MAGRLDGKVAIVTGAASGMGKAIAIEYLKEGAKIIAADINEVRLSELEEEVKEMGYSDSMKTFKCDITSTDDCENVVKACVETYGTYNTLSHNAGVIDDFTMVERIKDEAWDKVFAINTKGAMKMCRSSLKYFRANGIEAHIVLITSNGAFESATGGPAYCASKAAANALMKSIAFEYGREGIRCNSICPGPVLTNIIESMKDKDEEGYKIHNTTGYNAASWQWTGGELAMPEQIAPLAVYLASDESNFVNGASHLIDAGVCLSR